MDSSFSSRLLQVVFSSPSSVCLFFLVGGVSFFQIFRFLYRFHSGVLLLFQAPYRSPSVFLQLLFRCCRSYFSLKFQKGVVCVFFLCFFQVSFNSPFLSSSIFTRSFLGHPKVSRSLFGLLHTAPHFRSGSSRLPSSF